MSEDGIAKEVQELNVKNLVTVLRDIGTKLDAIAVELKTKNDLAKERLEFTRAKDEILAALSKTLRKNKKGEKDKKEKDDQ